MTNIFFFVDIINSLVFIAMLTFLLVEVAQIIALGIAEKTA